jgi:poly-gamma-glutamate synthesis protein (capsule biosynthesis protein)
LAHAAPAVDDPRVTRKALAVLALAVAGCSAEALGGEADQTEPAAAPPTNAPAPGASAPPGGPATSAEAPWQPVIVVSAVGDCTLGDPAGTERAPGSFHRAHEDGDMARPFSAVHAVLSEDDVTIANLETTLTTAAHRRDTVFAFRGKPEFARMLAAGSVELVSVANNHSGDCGPRGLEETKQSLASAGVGWFGLGTADKRVVRGIEVVNLGYLGGRLDVREQVKRDVARHKQPGNLVIASFHWGIEGEHTVTDVQQKLGRAAIDAGADLVLGHHPHVLQGIETYKGKKIVYSLANFVFGGHARPTEIESMIYRARFIVEDGAVVPQGDEVIPVIVTGNRAQNDFRPVLLEGPEAARVRADVRKWGALIPSQGDALQREGSR